MYVLIIVVLIFTTLWKPEDITEKEKQRVIRLG